MLENGSISGTITDISGRPVVDAAVFIAADSPVHADIVVLTDDQGRYQLDDLGVGRFTVMVNAPGRAPLSANIMVDGRNRARLDFVLGY